MADLPRGIAGELRRYHVWNTQVPVGMDVSLGLEYYSQNVDEDMIAVAAREDFCAHARQDRTAMEAKVDYTRREVGEPGSGRCATVMGIRDAADANGALTVLLRTSPDEAASLPLDLYPPCHVTATLKSICA